MSNYYTMRSHYTFIYRADGMFAIPVTNMHAPNHVEDLLNANPNVVPVAFTAAQTAPVQTTPLMGKLSKGVVVTTLIIWCLPVVIAAYILVRETYKSFAGISDPQFCIRSASATYH